MARIHEGDHPDAARATQAAVADILQSYAERGFFRSFGTKPGRGKTRIYQVVWHHERRYDIVLNLRAGSISFPALLPGVSPGSPLQRELREFLAAFSGDQVPAHRRVNPPFGKMSVYARPRGLTLSMKVHDGAYEYCARKLVHVVHEIFMVFLWDGPYYDYRVEHLGLNPDTARP